jgi:hypothetical protein
MTLNWEHNCHGYGCDFLRTSHNTRFMRIGATDFLYMAEQWGDHSLRYPLTGRWCRTLREARQSMPAPWREAHTMPAKESLHCAISLVLETHFEGRFPEGVDRLHGYLQRRVTDEKAPRMDRLLRETWEAFADDPSIATSADAIASFLFQNVKERCAAKGILFEELTPSVLDQIDEAWR